MFGTDDPTWKEQTIKTVGKLSLACLGFQKAYFVLMQPEEIFSMFRYQHRAFQKVIYKQVKDASGPAEV